MVFPFSVWPIKGGGTARLWAMIDGLRTEGFDIVLIGPDEGRVNADISSKVNAFEPFVLEERNFITRVKNKVSGTSLPDKLRMPKLEQCVAQASLKHSPMACITHFVRTARLFDNLSDDCLKCMDTHEIQYLRSENAQQHGGEYTGPKWTREEEIVELNRANVLMAIQDLEEVTLRELCPDKKVITVGHSVSVEPSTEPVHPPELLYVGNLYEPNVAGLNAFIDEAWPSIHSAVPDVTLHVCGRICDATASTTDGVMLHGVVDDLQPYYRRAAVVINPVMYGTGLKIKTVEALGFGKAMVSTPAGILGVGRSGDIPVQVVESPGDMAPPIIEMLTVPEIRREWESKAHIFAQNNLTVERIMEPLVKLLNEREQI